MHYHPFFPKGIVQQIRAIIPRPTAKEIKPSLYLHQDPDVFLHYCQDVDIDRFVRVYRDTWKRFPYGMRRLIFAYWRTLYAPAICFADAEHFVQKTGSGACGMCQNGGKDLLFNIEDVNLMPD